MKDIITTRKMTTIPSITRSLFLVVCVMVCQSGSISITKTAFNVSDSGITVAKAVDISDGGFSISSDGMSTAPTVICKHPGEPDNCFTETWLMEFSPGEEIRFDCYFTYRMVGSANRTCLADGTWSGVQPKCERYRCQDIYAPDNGRRIGNNFTFGHNITFGCALNYELKGERKSRCLQNGQWSAKPPTCHHVCEKVQCAIGLKCVVQNGSTTCVCKDNMDCTARNRVVCGSDAQTYINECIMKATACRKNKKIDIVKPGHCALGHRCSIDPVSNCRAAFPVFYYNATSTRCEPMIAGGCHHSGWNGFHSKMKCTFDCMNACSQKPEHGPCTNQLKRWYFNSKKCVQFDYGGCYGSTNNFLCSDDCEKRCMKDSKKPIPKTKTTKSQHSLVEIES